MSAMVDTVMNGVSSSPMDLTDEDPAEAEEEVFTPRKRMRRSSRSHASSTPSPSVPSSSSSPYGSPSTYPGSAEHAKCGIITKIRVDDFLCHECFEVDLNPNCNFIVGKNGSGKSALMIALQVCLGARATETQRGMSLKQFVRWGSDHAIVSVTLKNEGDDAFEPDTYGSRIVIRRIIPVNGTARYQICDEEGGVISTKRHTLQPILEHLNIRVGNPCVVLSQDRSREFFQSCTNEKLYHFFLEATSLENMRKQIADSVDKQAQMERLIESKQENMPDLQAKFKKAQDDYKAADTLKHLETRVSDFEKAISWALVDEIDQQIQHEQRKIARKEKKQGKLEELLTIEHKQCEVLEEEATKLQKELKNFSEEEQKLSSEARDLNNEVKKHSRLHRTAQSNLSANQQSIGSFKRQITNALRRIKKIEREASRDIEAESQQIKRALENHFNALKEAKKKLEEIKQEQKDCEDPQQYQDQLRQLLRIEKEKNAKLTEVLDRIKQIKRSRKNSLACFGVRTPEVLEEIQRQHRRFKVPPIGPVGRYIKLLQTQWAKPIELCLTPAVLCGYIVDNYEDQNLLKSILRHYPTKHGVPYVIVQRFSDRPYELSDRTFNDLGIYRVVDHIEVQNIWAKNVVIDQTQCERYILLERSGGEGDPNGAYEFLKRNRGNSHIQRKLAGVWTKDGCKVVDRNGRSIGSTYHRHDRRFLNVDYENELKALDGKRIELQNELGVHNNDRRRLTGLRSEASNKKRALSHKCLAVENDIRRTEDTINDLQRQLDVEQDSHDELIKEIQNEVKQCEEHIEGKQKEQESLMEEEKRTAEEYHQLKAKRSALVNKGTELSSCSTDVRDKLEQVMKQHRVHKNRITNMIRRKEEFEGENNITKTSIEALQKILEERTNNAKELSEERVQIPSGETSDTLTRALERMNIQIDVEKERLNGDVEEIKDRMERAGAKLNEAKDIVRDAEGNLDAYRRACRVRNREWKRFRKTISEDATQQFAYYLKRENHTGNINFNHDSRTLEMNVQMASHAPSNESVSDTKALSGGERSYTTLAFILALSESMNCPFRCIDEFDIYMDAVNRKISTHLLLSIASQLRNRQFIFLTPLDTSMVEVGQHVQIVKLKTPKRNGLTQ